MPTKCTPCQEAGRICKVHIRSGLCSVCNASNSKRCDIYITTLEFSRLLKERASLDIKLKEAYKLVELAYAKLLEANEQFNTAYTKLSRIQKQIDFNARRTNNAIIVEERNILELEAKE